MNKRLLVVVVMLVLAAAGVAYAALNDADEPTATNSPGTNNAQQSGSTTRAAGDYVKYTDSVISTTKGDKVLFFHAPWCPQCRSIEADIKEQGVPAGLTVIKVDYDSNQALRQKYGVTIQTTFVKVDDQGNFIARYVAYDEPTFEAVKENFL